MLLPNLGDCHNIAVALNVTCHLPICIFYGERWKENCKECVLIHAGVVLNNYFIDETGISGTTSHVLEEFKENNAKYDKTETFYFQSYEDPKLLELLKRTGTKINTLKVEKFQSTLVPEIKAFLRLDD